MPRIVMNPDNLNQVIGKYEQALLKEPVFLNSVPKSGTHLIKNIFRMFVSLDQTYPDVFIQFPNLEENRYAFDPANPKLSWGHLLFADSSSIYLRKTNHVLLVRDPYDWVLARARFFMSENFQGNMDQLKSGHISIDEIMNMMIFGLYQTIPAMYEIFENNCLAWMGTKAKIVRYEDLLDNVKNLDSDEAEVFFTELFDHCNIELPSDWRERVRVGSDRKQSATARENLNIAGDPGVPDVLPDIQKKLVDIAAPSLREILGYT